MSVFPGKRVLVSLMYLIMVFSIQAQTITGSGSTWTVTNATAGSLAGLFASRGVVSGSVTKLTIPGTLDARDFVTLRTCTKLEWLDLSGATIAQYTGTGGTVGTSRTYSAHVVPEKAFYNALTGSKPCTIQLPTSVSVIERYAFSGCTALETIDLKYIVDLREGAFSGSGVRHVDLYNLSFMEDEVFYGCYKLVTVAHCSVLSNACFAWCTALTSIDLTGITWVENQAFSNCTSLTNVTFDPQLRFIESWAFSDCSVLAAIDLPATLQDIGDEAFSGCTSLKTITVHQANPASISLGDAVFDGVPKTTCTVYVPSSSAASSYKTADQWKDFANINAFTVPTVSTQAVTNIKSLTATGNGTVTVVGGANITQHGVVWSTSPNPTTVLATKTNLGAKTTTGAFSSTLTGLTPGTKYYARAYATNSVGTAYGAQVEFTTLPTSINLAGTTATINNAVPGSLVGSLLSDAQWASLTRLTLNGTIDARDFVTLKKCTKLEYLDLSGVTIASYNGTEGPSFRETNFPANQIPDDGFNGALKGSSPCTILLPASVTAVRNYAFSGCTALEVINLENVQFFGTSAFSETGLRSVNLSSTEHMEEEVFYFCEQLTTVNHCQVVGRNCFYGCTALTSIDLSNVSRIDQYAIGACSNLASVVFASYLYSIDRYAFEGCSKLTAIDLPASIRYLEDGAFEGCTALRSLICRNPDATTIRTSDAVFAGVPTSATLRVPLGARAGYAAVNPWSAFTIVEGGLVAPGVSTAAATNVGSGSATLNGSLSNLGDTTVTQHGFVWSTSPGPTTELATKTTLGTKHATGVFSSTITGLTPGTTYYVRAYATNAAGTSYGLQVTLTTPRQLTVKNPPSVWPKIYDGTTKATLASVGTLEGLATEDLDKVNITATAAFNDASVGTGKTVTVHYVLNGAASTKYIAPADLQLTTGAIHKGLSVKVYLEGLWAPGLQRMNKCQDYDATSDELVDYHPGDMVDQISLELRTTHYPTVAYTIDTLYLLQDGSVVSEGFSSVALPPSLSGNYYLTVRHRNHLPVASASLVSFDGNLMSYDFTDSATKAFVCSTSFPPSKLVDGKWMLYGGNVTDEDTGYPEINVLDVYRVFNQQSALTGTYGYSVYDVDGNGVVDLQDVYTVFNNRDVLLYRP